MDRVVDDYEPVIAGLDNDMREIEVDVFAPIGTAPTRAAASTSSSARSSTSTGTPSRCWRPCSGCRPGQVPSSVRRCATTSGTCRTTCCGWSPRSRTSVTCSPTPSTPTWRSPTVRQNDDMRKISAAVAIGAVPTVVGAIYGMNFRHMPELESRLGYPAVLILTVLACVYLYRRFKRSGWL